MHAYITNCCVHVVFGKKLVWILREYIRIFFQIREYNNSTAANFRHVLLCGIDQEEGQGYKGVVYDIIVIKIHTFLLFTYLKFTCNLLNALIQCALI